MNNTRFLFVRRIGVVAVTGMLIATTLLPSAAFAAHKTDKNKKPAESEPNNKESSSLITHLLENLLIAGSDKGAQGENATSTGGDESTTTSPAAATSSSTPAQASISPDVTDEQSSASSSADTAATTTVTSHSSVPVHVASSTSPLVSYPGANIWGTRGGDSYYAHPTLSPLWTMRLYVTAFLLALFGVVFVSGLLDGILDDLRVRQTLGSARF